MEQLVNFIIRPPRAEYDPKSDLLDYEFMLKGKWFQRRDVEIKNSRGDVLQCSHYMPIVSPDGKPLPCVIYCHGNSGCRADASEAAIILLPSNITVFTLDFSGSGISGGEHVTLGWNEKDDLRAVVNYLRADGNVSLIGLWGRSMGAVTSLMYGAEDPSIAGMVLDSPFSDLVDLMMELVDTYRVRLPKFTVKFAIQYMRKTIQKKAKFDIMDLNTIKVAKSCFVPALVGHAIDDDFIRPHHSDRILEAYMGDKNIIKFEGDHNSPRPQFYFDSVNIFFHNILQPPEDELGESFFDIINDYFGKDVWGSVDEFDYGNEPSFRNKEPSTSSTVDDIKQVRSKRPMSRMEIPPDISSKYGHRDSKAEKCDDVSSSSSTMISFELSNGHLYSPLVPTNLDDDQYVEYQLDDFTGCPSRAEEEQKMFIEAVIDSLENREIRNPEVKQPPVSSASTIFAKPSNKDDSHEISKPMETESSLLNHTVLSTASTISTASDVCEPLKAESNSISVIPSSVPSLSSTKIPPSPLPPPPLDTSSIPESGNTKNASTGNDSSASLQSSSDTDISHKTKATLTVIKNPASHVLNGLIRRWDFNFFRNSHKR
ncbi:YqkD protein [Spatholobus suberectus]|nr:YqkD protein [Spatholobus suberectus]